MKHKREADIGFDSNYVTEKSASKGAQSSLAYKEAGDSRREFSSHKVFMNKNRMIREIDQTGKALPRVSNQLYSGKESTKETVAS